MRCGGLCGVFEEALRENGGGGRKWRGQAMKHEALWQALALT
jgi:hypothetical protein